MNIIGELVENDWVNLKYPINYIKMYSFYIVSFYKVRFLHKLPVSPKKLMKTFSRGG